MASITCASAATIGACIATFWRDRMPREALHLPDCLREDASGDPDDRFSIGGFSARIAARDDARFVLTSKSYLRDNVFDVYAQDDWRVLPNLTLNLWRALRVFCAVYGEVRASRRCGYQSIARFTGIAEVKAGGAAVQRSLPDSLVFPFRTAFAPRIGLGAAACRSRRWFAPASE